MDRRVVFWLATIKLWDRALLATPFGERFAWGRASRYVAGVTAEEALHAAWRLPESGVASSIDYFGELVTDKRGVDVARDTCIVLASKLAGAPPDTWLAVDLSQIGLDIGVHE